MTYLLQGIQLETEYHLSPFEGFSNEKIDTIPVITLHQTAESWDLLPIAASYQQKEMTINRVPGGWVYSSYWDENQQFFVDEEYKHISVHLKESEIFDIYFLPMLQVVLELVSLRQNILSLHSACIQLNHGAVCLAGKSGIGKSTRARAWMSALKGTLISGDRPQILINENGALACGVPWDGKEKIYKRDQAPLLAIGVVRRSNIVRVRRVTQIQARKWLMKLCFVPMWETEYAFLSFQLINLLCKKVPIYKILSAPGEEDARKVHQILFETPQEILPARPEIRIKEGFVLHTVMNEFIVTPAGKRIGKYEGSIVLNEVGAFLWKQLEQGVCREDLIDNLLEEYHVLPERAEKDVDLYLKKLDDYQVLEEI